MRMVHELGKYLAVHDTNGVERVRYQYQMDGDPSPSAPKPFCHPVRDATGNVLTARSPLDHFWHRGIWFAWKYVNGVNYWEERDAVFGRQITLTPPTLSPVANDPNAVQWTSELEWRDPQNGPHQTARLQETRQITCTFHESEQVLTLDWVCHQTAQELVVLDRTPFTTWGGYGGIVARTTQAVHKQKIVFDDGTDSIRPLGEPHLWGGMEGQLDTLENGDAWMGLVLMPSPNNRRFPEPFYGGVKPFTNFYGPAPLFHEPLVLADGEVLRHAVRVLFVPRRVTPDDISPYYKAWAQTEAAASP